jgi:DNA-binding HxlR family transcriptional regulator
MLGGLLEVAPSVSLRSQLAQIVASCQALSERFRLCYRRDAVFERLRNVIGDARPLFQEWTPEICFLLEHHGVLRYGQLQRLLPGISTRTLAAKLQLLQEHGLVSRVTFDESPPRVEYRLTSRGREFAQSLFATLVLLRTDGDPAPLPPATVPTPG